MPLTSTSRLGHGNYMSDFPTERREKEMEERKSGFFYCCDKMLWLFKSGWPQVPLILGRPRVSVGDWYVFSCLTVCLLSTGPVKQKCYSHFNSSQRSFPADTTFISVNSKELRIQESCPKKNTWPVWLRWFQRVPFFHRTITETGTTMSSLVGRL